MLIISYGHNIIYSTYTYSYVDIDNDIIFLVMGNPCVPATERYVYMWEFASVTEYGLFNLYDLS